jgi:hypothetical protein
MAKGPSCAPGACLLEEWYALRNDPTSRADAVSSPGAEPSLDVDAGNNDEKEYRRLILDLAAEDRPTALCLSGGGIRSATFSLGVLQGLAVRGALGRFTYLSSVSGGGYVAGWLCARLRVLTAAAAVPAAPGSVLPQLTADLCDAAATGAAAGIPLPANFDADNSPVGRLRAYSHYLSPVMGLSGDMLALITTFARNLVLNLCVWLPLLAALVLVPRLAATAILANPLAHRPDAVVGMAAVAVALLVVGLAYMVSDARGQDHPNPAPADRFMAWGFAPPAAGAILLVFAGLWCEEGWIARVKVCSVAAMASTIIGMIAGVGWRTLRRNSRRSIASGILTFTALLATSAIGGGLLALVMSLARRLAGHEDTAALVYLTFAFPLVLACFWVQMTLCAAAARRWTHEDDREWLARSGGVWLLAALGWAACFGLVLFVSPWVLSMLAATLSPGAQLTGGSAVLGVLTSAFGYWSKNGDRIKERAEGFLARLGDKALEVLAGAVLLAVATMMTIFVSWIAQQPLGRFSILLPDERAQAAFLHQSGAQAAVAATLAAEAPDADAARANLGEAAAYHYAVFHAHAWPTAFWLLTFAGAAALLSYLMGANAFSLHNMYGNRLVRAYLGAARDQRRPHWFTGFDPGDNIALNTCKAPVNVNGRRCLFPVVNMNLNLVRARTDTMAWQQRKGESFIATPLRCGSARTGYAKTALYGGRNGMRLGRAMTISGAAASPNMGYHSSTLVTMVMTLFNVRLGWWLANPRERWQTRWADPEPVSGLRAMLDEALGRTTDERAAVYLSDGGHFENLGLYEMVRRRCHRILVVDAGCDADYQYSDLFNAVRKVRVDFGIRISVPQKLPGQPGATGCARMAVARIRYSDRDGGPPEKVDGFLFVLKPLINGCEPPDLREYAATTSKNEGTFPQQSTVDQFFDETQFESYRLLGLHTLLESWTTFEEAKMAPGNDECACDDPGPRPGAGPSFASDAASGAASEPASRGSASAGEGLAGLVRSVGPGVALATAMTVGGTIAAVGTVRLSSTEIHLSAADRKLLQQLARPAPAASAPVVTEPPVPPASDALAAAVAQAQRAASSALAASESAHGAASAAGGSASDAQAWARQAEEHAASAARSAAEAAQQNAIVGAIQSLQSVIASRPISGKVPPPPSAISSSASASEPSTIDERLKEMTKGLNTLHRDLAALQPHHASPSH